MMVYLLKTIACAAILLLVYRFFLEQEKMHGFNRFYLLFGVVFSGIIPLLTIEVEAPMITEWLDQSDVRQPVQAVPAVLPKTVTQHDLASASATVTEKSVYLTDILYGLYALISTGFLIRFGINLAVLAKKAIRKPVVWWKGSRVVLLPDKTPIHSFFHTVFVNEDDFRNHRIEAELLAHETAHLHQKHSLDLLFMELVLAVGWLNPILFFYRRAIRLNHEFLADEAVLGQYANVKRYQSLLLDNLRQNSQTALTSPFNFSSTKGSS